MALKTSVKITGGKKLERFLREAGKGGASTVKVGFFSTAKYQDGTPVAAVAAWNEFGTKTIPERRFFRQAIADSRTRRGIVNTLKNGIDPERMIVDETLADTIGAVVTGQVQESITALRNPPNSPKTIRRKRSSNPLIDTGMMRASVGWSVDDGQTKYPPEERNVKPPEAAPR